MIRRGFSPAGKMAFAAALALVCAATAFGQPAIEELLGKMPAESSQEIVAVSQSLIALGPEAIQGVCATLLPSGGDDVNARFLLSGLADHVSRGDAEEARAMVSGAFIQALGAAEDPNVKTFLMSMLQVCGSAEAVDALAGYLGDEVFVEPATQALLTIRTENVAPALKAAFEGAQGARAVTLMKALGELRQADAADKIVPFTRAEDRETRLVAYQALAEMGASLDLEPMGQAYEAAPPYEKAKLASYGLNFARRWAEAGNMEAAHAICDYLRSHGQVTVRSAALATLIDIGHPSAQSLLLAAMDEPDPAYRAAALKFAARFPSTQATREWLTRMKDVTPEVQAEIITMLGARGDNTASNTLARQILADDKVVRLAAMDATTLLAGSRAVAPMLHRLINGAEDDEIQTIQSALLRVPGRQVVKACGQALHKTPAPARIALLDVLKQRRGEIVRREVFVQTEDSHEAVRLAALDALLTVARPEDIPRVVDLVIGASTDQEKEAGRAVLVVLASQKPAPLLNAIAKQDGQSRADLLPVLPTLGSEEAYHAAAASVDSGNPTVKDATIRALSNWPEPLAMPQLLEIARATDNDTHHALALSGFLRLLPTAPITPPEKVAQYQEALDAARRKEERLTALSGLAAIRTLESLQLVAHYLDADEVKADAALAAAQIACPQDEKDPGLTAAEVAPILQKAREGADSEDLRNQIDEHLAAIAPPEPPSEDVSALEEGFVSLFNGVDLTGWEGDTDGYAAEDGLLVCKPGGNLYTVKDYANFVLRLEFKLTPGANNGLAVRVPMPAHAAYDGMELQILDDTHEKYNALEPYQFHGSIYGIVPARKGFLKPVGEWNEQEVIADGPHIVVKLNGEVIVDADIAEASKDGTLDGKEHPGLLRESGRLGFCGHGDVLYFRNLRVKELP
ncbi:MAG: family 16 glycoside hydrolase [Candidatus Hydrogenedentales bacterium]